jgi:hypothetical protein
MLNALRQFFRDPEAMLTQWKRSAHMTLRGYPHPDQVLEEIKAMDIKDVPELKAATTLPAAKALIDAVVYEVARQKAVRELTARDENFSPEKIPSRLIKGMIKIEEVYLWETHPQLAQAHALVDAVLTPCYPAAKYETYRHMSQHGYWTRVPA